MDFNLVIFSLLVVSGAIYLADVLVLRKRRPKDKVEPWLVEYARSFFPVILVVFAIRAFVIEPFRIPSGSMIPTLLVGDFVAVDKFSYGLRLPILGTKLTSGRGVSRGDVMVFHFPQNPSRDFIKRVVGLPGDTLAYVNRQLIINGEPVPLNADGTYQYLTDQDFILEAQKYREVLGGSEHDIILVPKGSALRMDPITIPDGHYFVMGDNRDNSNDSRFWGFVPDRLVVGRAFGIWLSWDHENTTIRWKRIGSAIP